MNTSKNLQRLVIAIILAVAVYAAFGAWTGYATIASRLSGFSWSSMALACALAIGNYLLRFAKWEYYLKRLQVRRIPKLDSLLVFFSGFVLTLTPAKVGEVFKSLLLFNTHAVPIAHTAPIIVAERLTDTIAITILIVIGLKGLAFQGALTWACVGAAIVLACVIVIMSQTLSELVLLTLERMPGPFRRLAPKARESWNSLRLMTSPNALLIPSVLSIAAWALEGIALCVILRGFGSHVPVHASVFIYSTATLAGAVASAPGGLGVTELALNGQLQAIAGVGAAIAASSMILVRFATLWLAILLGFVSLGLLRLRFPGLRTPATPPQKT